MAQYEVWRSERTQILYLPHKYSSRLYVEEFWNDRVVQTLFSEYWWTSIPIALVYVLIVHTMQWAMRDRKPFDLKRPLLFWNAGLAVFSAVATWRFAEEVLFSVRTYGLRATVSYSVNPREPAAFWACAFALSKVAELADTLFVVLRKRPLIFLHWYHHAVVLIYVWHSACELTAAGRWFIFMNYAVHSVMYTYYAVAAAGYRLPKWMSMAVTSAQTLQMLIGLVISFWVLRLKLSGVIVQQSYDNLGLCFAIYASFAALFIHFFKRSYLGKKSSSVPRKTDKSD